MPCVDCSVLVLRRFTDRAPRRREELLRGVTNSETGVCAA
jgi:hypothetical protein